MARRKQLLLETTADGALAATPPKTKRNSSHKTPDPPKTTAQQLASLIKSARDIMRKDKGLNGDLDRLPMLTWIMFLKFLDDREKLEEARAGIGGKKYKPAVEAPYRWRDWAAGASGITGPELIAFVNQEEAVRPDGKRGPGLLAYLRGLQSTNGDRRRDVIATVFTGVINRMISGYLLRDVINLVDRIHFDSSEDIHTLGRLYESMLREMRDAAGDSGEFYTPRPVVQFMVAVTNPQLGEVVLDPACGTGGFLAESFQHLEQQCKTVQDRRLLQEKSIRGGEAKPLPYMLAQMNLLLHGLDAPAIDYGNSLAVKITELGERDRVDVILTNPPFGGEEEAGIRGNFPADKQTSETALLFLQLIMRKLRRPGSRATGSASASGATASCATGSASASGAGAACATGSASAGGRAAVIVPNGTLFGDGVAARIKEELLKEFNLHTIVRLPNGVFAPYTSIPTNLLFFDRNGPTKEIWYYELPLPEGRKNYSKTKPIQFEEFADCIDWFTAKTPKKRKETDRALRVPAADVLNYDADGSLLSCNLDIKNPNAAESLEHLPPEKLVEDILAKEHRIIEIVEEIKRELLGRIYEHEWTHPIEHLGAILRPIKREVSVRADVDYELLGARWYAKGLYTKEIKSGSLIKASKLFEVREGDFVYNRLFAWKGSFAVASHENNGCFVSNEFPCFQVDQNRLDPKYLWYYFSRQQAWTEALGLSYGATPTSRNRLNERQLFSIEIPLPPLAEQRRIVAKIDRLAAKINNARLLQIARRLEVEAILKSSRRVLLGDEPAPNWVALRDAVQDIENGWSPACRKHPASDGKWGVLKVGAVSFGTFDPSENKELPDSLDPKPDYEIKAGDFLMSRANTVELVGACAMVRETPSRLMLCDKIFRFRFHDDRRVEPAFLDHVLKSPALRTQIEAGATGTSPTMRNISKAKIMGLRIPIPEVQEQRRIIVGLDAVQAQTDDLATIQTQTAAELNALLPSILDRAFKGEL